MRRRGALGSRRCAKNQMQIDFNYAEGRARVESRLSLPWGVMAQGRDYSASARTPKNPERRRALLPLGGIPNTGKPFRRGGRPQLTTEGK
jgi:hypothetical protein